MSGHDDFRQLAALEAIGQVTTAEHGELAAHLSECPECREAYADYARILRQDLPQANPGRFRLKQSALHPASDAERRERFLARARAHGADFSPEVERGVSPFGPRPALVYLTRWALSVAALLIVLTVTFAFVLHKGKSAPPANTVLERQLHDAIREVATLKAELSRQSINNERNLSSALSEKDARLSEAKRRVVRLNAQLDRIRAQNAALKTANERDQSSVTELNGRLQTLEASNDSSNAAMAKLQDQIRLLNGAVEQEAEKLAMERQLTTISSDVRQLMGARNLHIIDVHDVNGSGKAAKSFGRVFYSEGRSLVFYAFDLPNGKLTPAKYHFQAWGQQEGQAQSVHNLGTFSIDDHEQHRWVLKVSDASLLQGVDSVFVTAEATFDVGSPRGKPILYAYLAGRANHP